MCTKVHKCATECAERRKVCAVQWRARMHAGERELREYTKLGLCPGHWTNINLKPSLLYFANDDDWYDDDGHDGDDDDNEDLKSIKITHKIWRWWWRWWNCRWWLKGRIGEMGRRTFPLMKRQLSPPGLHALLWIIMTTMIIIIRSVWWLYGALWWW